MEKTTQSHLLSPQARRLRNRQEVTDAILSAAREIMRRDGVAALNINEVARQIGMQPPSLYKYFPGKFALYDTLFAMGVRLFHEHEVLVWKSTPPSWERIRVWFETRLRLAQEHPDLYHLVFDNPVPGFVPSEEGLEETRQMRMAGVQAMTEMIDAGIITPSLPAERVFDLLLAVRRGIIAEQLGKEPHLPAGDQRFSSLIPEVLTLFQAAWTPQ